MVFPEFTLISRTIGGLGRRSGLRMEVIQREIAEDVFNFSIVARQHFVQRRLYPFTEWAMKIREFHDCDRRIRIASNTVGMSIKFYARGVEPHHNR